MITPESHLSSTHIPRGKLKILGTLIPVDLSIALMVLCILNRIVF